jgi:hypothetical protein
VPEFLGLIGLPVSVAVVFAAIFSLFQLLETVASPVKKADLSGFLRSADWEVLPHKITSAFRDVFEAIFGKNHLSEKCFRRSLLFSLLAISILFVVSFLKNYEYFHTMPAYVVGHPSYYIIFFGWLFWSVLFDYLNLYKTRFLIRVIDLKVVPAILFFLLVAVDLLFSFAIFDLSQNAFHALSMVSQYCVGLRIGDAGCTFLDWIKLTFDIFLINNHNVELLYLRLHSVVLGPTTNEIATFFWSGLLPTLWLLLYVVATAVTRYLVKISDFISFTIAWLDVDKPFQLIGFVAALLVGLLMVIYNLASIAV